PYSTRARCERPRRDTCAPSPRPSTPRRRGGRARSASRGARLGPSPPSYPAPRRYSVGRWPPRRDQRAVGTPASRPRPRPEGRVVELGFPLDQSATAETETLIFLKQWHTELEHDRFVSDYSLFHVLAYADWVMENAAERKENHLWREAREIATFGLSSRYDHVFYLPIEFPIVPDELRPDDPAFQAEIDSRVHRLLDTHEVPYH